jgi:hypothetical protein
VRVHAENEKLGYRIQGELKEKFLNDEETGDVIAQIPALGLIVQGRDAGDAAAMLERAFGEFCEVAIEESMLLDTLVARGFTVSSPKKGDRPRPKAPQYLEISQLMGPGDGVSESKVLAQEGESGELELVTA